jgi:hypothetical protein
MRAVNRISNSQHHMMFVAKVIGCELPGGEVLLVQPSDPLHKLRTKAKYGSPLNINKPKNSDQPSTSTDAVARDIFTFSGNKDKEKGDSDILGDFFASFE